jgi:2-dehydropantoate 2-reductase
MQRDGLRFSGTLGEYSVPVRALHVSDVQTLAHAPVDIAFICTKLYDTAWTATLARDYLAPDSFVVTMQNSVVEEMVAGIVGWGRTLGCIASTMSVELHAPARIKRTRQPGGAAYTIFRAGEMHGRITQRLEKLVEMLSLVDSAKATSNLWGERWGKLVANTMTTGVSGVTGLSLKSVLEDAATRRLMVRLGAEAVKIGLARGYAIEPVRRLAPEVWLRADEGDAEALSAVDGAIAVELERMTDAAYSGVEQDLRKGRRTEIDYMNGFVARQGDEIGIPAPTHGALTALVKRIERRELAPERNLINLLT